MTKYQEIKFLGTLQTLLDRSKVAYNAYIFNGQIFLYAKILKECNTSIKKLLVENAYLLPSPISSNAIAIIHHIDVWETTWDDLYENTEPTLTTVFTFENRVRFPQKEASILMNYYESLRSSLDM